MFDFRLIIASIAIIFCGPAISRKANIPAWELAQYTDQELGWFKSVKSPRGVPCCDIADGHKTTWRGVPESGENSHYEVPINDDWVPVPKASIIYNAGNPMGEAIVWYVDQGFSKADGEAEHHHYYIRCFVPDGGV